MNDIRSTFEEALLKYNGKAKQIAVIQGRLLRE